MHVPHKFGTIHLHRALYGLGRGHDGAKAVSPIQWAKYGSEISRRKVILIKGQQRTMPDNRYISEQFVHKRSNESRSAVPKCRGRRMVRRGVLVVLAILARCRKEPPSCSSSNGNIEIVSPAATGVDDAGMANPHLDMWVCHRVGPTRSKCQDDVSVCQQLRVERAGN